MHILERIALPRSLWFSDMSLGIAAMDASHRTLLDKLAQLWTVSDAEFPAHYAAMVARVESDFREEEALMEKIDFPGIQSHREQHAKVLGGLHRAASAVMEGDIALGRQAISMLPEWFVFHISTMDTALAFALQFRSEELEGIPAAGGTPSA